MKEKVFHVLRRANPHPDLGSKINADTLGRIIVHSYRYLIGQKNVFFYANLLRKCRERGRNWKRLPTGVRFLYQMSVDHLQICESSFKFWNNLLLLSAAIHVIANNHFITKCNHILFLFYIVIYIDNMHETIVMNYTTNDIRLFRHSYNYVTVIAMLSHAIRLIKCSDMTWLFCWH